MLINTENLQEELITGRELFFPEIILQSHSGKSCSTPGSTGAGAEPPALHLCKEPQKVGDPPQAALGCAPFFLKSVGPSQCLAPLVSGAPLGIKHTQLPPPSPLAS